MNDEEPISEFLRFLHAGLDTSGEEIYLAPSDNVPACANVYTLERAIDLAQEWRDRGCFVSTGTFARGTARDAEHLLATSSLLLDADLLKRLEAEGRTPEEAWHLLSQCPPEALTRVAALHRKVIVET